MPNEHLSISRLSMIRDLTLAISGTTVIAYLWFALFNSTALEIDGHNTWPLRFFNTSEENILPHHFDLPLTGRTILPHEYQP